MTSPKLIIAVSVDGEYPSAPIAIGTADQIFSGISCASIRVFGEDVVRARNRLAQTVLDTTDAEAILWWDTDTYVPNLNGTLGVMLESGHDVIGAAYPRKRKPRALVGVPLPDAKAPDERGIAEVAAVGFGFTLTTRKALDAIGASADTYVDALSTGDRVRTANIFGLAYRHLEGDGLICSDQASPCQEVELVSEDYSFCLRWRETGGRIYMLTPKTPVHHMGMHSYE